MDRKNLLALTIFVTVIFALVPVLVAQGAEFKFLAEEFELLRFRVPSDQLAIRAGEGLLHLPGLNLGLQFVPKRGCQPSYIYVWLARNGQNSSRFVLPGIDEWSTLKESLVQQLLTTSTTEFDLSESGQYVRITLLPPGAPTLLPSRVFDVETVVGYFQIGSSQEDSY